MITNWGPQLSLVGVELEHVFNCTAAGASEVDRLVALGVIEEPAVFFPEWNVELLGVDDAVEARRDSGGAVRRDDCDAEGKVLTEQQGRDRDSRPGLPRVFIW